VKEAQVTITILNWLKQNGWHIVCYDFPQSGTGTLIHPNSDDKRRTKNKGGIIPDIVAVKEMTAVYFENKSSYTASDFEKIREIKLNGNYSHGLSELLALKKNSNYFFGIAYGNSKKDKANGLDNLKDIDFLITVNSNSTINVIHDKHTLFKVEH
jgi:hypothetical protein